VSVFSLVDQLAKEITKRVGKPARVTPADDSTEIYIRVGKLRRTIDKTDIQAIPQIGIEKFVEELFPR
jgi:hypothetical protein